MSAKISTIFVAISDLTLNLIDIFLSFINLKCILTIQEIQPISSVFLSVLLLIGVYFVSIKFLYNNMINIIDFFSEKS